MSTPYDAALRVAERRLDEARNAIRRAADEAAQAQAARDGAASALRRERGLAADDWRLANDGYFQRARAEHARLCTECDACDARLQALRREAVACYGERAAIEGAVARFRAEAARVEAAAEQATLDDLSASRLTRVRARSRRPAAVVP